MQRWLNYFPFFLTIFKGIQEQISQYDFLYLGDNARTPYGNRSFETEVCRRRICSVNQQRSYSNEVSGRNCATHRVDN